MLIMLRVSEYGASDPAELQFEGTTITIGRGRDNDLTLPDQKVSKKHARIQVDGDGACYVMDLNSKNKTFVGSSQISQRPHQIYTGDTIHIGDFKIVFSKSLEAAWASPPSTELNSNSLDDADAFDRPVVRLIHALHDIAAAYGSLDEDIRDEELLRILRSGLNERLVKHPSVQHVIDALEEVRKDTSGRRPQRPWSLF